MSTSAPPHLDPATVARAAAAVDDLPHVVRAEAFVYPAGVAAFEPAAGARRPRPPGDHLRLYVHLPFCNYRCDFCHFATVTTAGEDVMARYVAAVERELLEVEPGAPLSQLFVGGGTPTALPPSLLHRVLRAVRARTRPFGSNLHTVEASPESVTRGHVDVLADHGIGRVSMGVQSLDDAVLHGVDRRHGRAEALAAIDLLVGAGLLLNVDLMYGLPGQTEASFAAALEEVASHGAHSLTLYALRVTPASRVGRAVAREDRVLDVARRLRWRAFVRDVAAAHGYAQVRPHTFKRPGPLADRHHREVCHDERVQGLQLGVGMSARSQLHDALWRNQRALPAYLAAVEAGESPVEGVMHLTPEDRGTKWIARTIGEGGRMTPEGYAAAVGRDFLDDHGPAVRRLTDGGLLDVVDGAYGFTPTGRLLYDRALVAFYPPAARARLGA